MSPYTCIFRFVVVDVVILLSYICVVRLFFVYFALVLLLFMCQFLHSFNIWRRRGENVWRPAAIIHSDCQPPFHSLPRCLLTLSVRTLSTTESFTGERYFVVRTREKDYPPPAPPNITRLPLHPTQERLQSFLLPTPPPPPPPPFTAGAAAKGQPLPLPVTWKGPPFPTSPHPASPPLPPPGLFPDHLAPTSFDLTPLKRKDGTSLQTEGSTGLTVFSGEHEEWSYFPRQRAALVTAAATWLIGYLGVS